MLNREYLQKMKTWAGFVAIITIIAGAISALMGLFALIVGAIPGIVTVFLGIKLLNAKRDAENLLVMEEVDPYHINSMILNLAQYFKIQGILFIVSIVLGILGFISLLLVDVSWMTL